MNASDHLPFTTLSYANGPGYKPDVNNMRYNLYMDDFSKFNLVIEWKVKETHYSLGWHLN